MARDQVVGERVEVADVEGEGDAVVAEVGEQGEGVVEAVVGQAVGAVAEPDRARAAPRPERRRVAVVGPGAHVGDTRREAARASGARDDEAEPRERGPGPGGEGALQRDDAAHAGAGGPRTVPASGER